ncbi:phospholipase D-like domain-containing protein, partial [Staphylococcus aureus]
FGTAYLYHRNLTLTFDVNAFIYDQPIANKLKQAFLDDLAVTSELTTSRYANRSLWSKFKEAISQLLS